MKGPSCFACVHHRDVEDDNGHLMSYCHFFDEYIDSEPLAATDCERYETMPPAEAPCFHPSVRWHGRVERFGATASVLGWAYCCDCDQLVATLGRTRYEPRTV